ncbi:MAG: divergent polysaccharide deacetylase family protein [Dissulfurimicrobium sp.]|uniref:divergent polysaccharide deacetylase family protein n=1 Tax=Dissulfurimicrobium sp. TaxID=2022436 RepID=UPI00404A265B
MTRQKQISPKRLGIKGRSKRFKGVALVFAAIAIIVALIIFIYLLPAPEVKVSPHHGRPQHPAFEKSGGAIVPSPTPYPSQQPRPQTPPKTFVPMERSLIPSHGAEKKTQRPLPKKAAQGLAILIDDMGYDMEIDNALLAIDAPISFAFLPGAPHTEKLAERAFKMGRDVLVHLPLEPLNSDIDPGPGALRLSMSPDVMLATLKKDLNVVPHAKGVNNHMGSRFTADRKAMEFILKEIRSRGLFFVDSKTTCDSVAYQVAREMGVPSAARSVFLDNDQNPDAIKKELEAVVMLAKRGRGVIAIGHPFPNTMRVLREELPVLKDKVQLVPVHALVRTN